MKKNILIINGSLREEGNTDIILKNFLNGIDKTKVDCTYIVLRDKKIAGCRGCYYCYNHTRCSIKDDMQEIHQHIQSSGLLVFASPMYWWGVTGLMKTFIDRLYLYYPRHNGKLIEGKKLLILTPMHVNIEEHGRKSYESEIEPLKMTSKYIFRRLGINIVDMIFYPGLNAKGDTTKHPSFLNEAKNSGQKVLSYFE